ncbi:UAA transporter [Viridothelium virens]|uniref:UAA transporter n=1 Tax=Viridothelium virens TaxID=1048519 RepID=A0A6A6HKC8_VIRVR|nr:UAA transporter [Viridothelium virens]
MLQSLGPVSTAALIFGGCCSNVFALEAIVKTEPDSGGLAAYPFQNRPQTSNTPSEKPPVPVYKWGVVAAMFFSVNMLNNWAFAFNISVPVHIILRSFGSVTTMGAGYLRGRRYSRIQLLSVVMLTLGVIQSAWADSESKVGLLLQTPTTLVPFPPLENLPATTLSVSQGKSMKAAAAVSDGTTIFGMGLLVLLIAQLLSAFMGTYVQDVYAYHTAHWTENLFYSHFLGLPLFLPLAWTLTTQYLRLARTPPLAEMPSTSRYMSSFSPAYDATAASSHGGGGLLNAVPGGLAMLLVNAVTQLACISGVNLLSAKSSAVTVTIVLNIRKLVSFMLSIWLFGNPLSLKMLAGAVLVFGSGALYGWETTVGIRLREERARKRGEEETVEPKRF